METDCRCSSRWSTTAGAPMRRLRRLVACAGPRPPRGLRTRPLRSRPSIVARVTAQFEEGRIAPPPDMTPEDITAYRKMETDQKTKDWPNVSAATAPPTQTRSRQPDSEPVQIVFMGDLDHAELGRLGGGLLHARYRQSRHQRPDDAADAGPVPVRRDRAQTQGRPHPGRRQRLSRWQHRPRHRGRHRGQPRPR